MKKHGGGYTAQQIEAIAMAGKIAGLRMAERIARKVMGGPCPDGAACRDCSDCLIRAARKRLEQKEREQ